MAFLGEINGKKTILNLIDQWKNNFSSYDSAKFTIVEKCKELFEKGIIKISYDYNIKVPSRDNLK